MSLTHEQSSRRKAKAQTVQCSNASELEDRAKKEAPQLQNGGVSFRVSVFEKIATPE